MEEIVCVKETTHGVIVDVGPKIVKVRYSNGVVHHYQKTTFTTIPAAGDKFTLRMEGLITPSEVVKAKEKQEAKGGSRKFAKISVEDFQAKIKAAIAAHDEYDPYEDDTSKPVDPMDNAAGLLHNLTSTVEKDLGKVNFTAENTYYEFHADNSPMEGFHQLDNGLTFLGVTCGGDWETPVYFILYWDGAKIRGYIPTDGNPWNRTTKKAFGNDNKADLADAMLQFPHENWDKEYYDNDIDHDWDKIKEDILGRLVEG